ncbi:ABC transporter permease [Anaerotalea alkaliphila]|uniref:ABC transporter permease n=1 Tax=Anaerotalea alkaliphila TaxID=2662126 RepID=A0A7X5HVK5_9FIRM|nr:ABC transporter permease [Anaerotalea alkaliphila]NDL67461.1 ABC transporter permease [Anaerotalea alkaliphila]
MLGKVFVLFKRDLKVGLRDFISLYIIVFPVLFALVINIFIPGINETTVNLALLEGENLEQAAYLDNFADVELFDSEEAMEERLRKRDNIIGILPGESGYVLATQGNEPESVVEYAKALVTYHAFGVTVQDTRGEIVDFGRTMPPLKRMLVAWAVLFASVLGGMLIAISIVEEKVDNTISAVNVTPLSRGGFILGKSLIGILVPVAGTVLLLGATGFAGVNLGQVILLLLTLSLISVLIGFIQGINNDDIMNAAASIKILFLPLFASVAAVEVMGERWQFLFYWIPFYWVYKGIREVLADSASWGDVLLYAGIVAVIGGVVYAVLAPRIRKGLE